MHILTRHVFIVSTVCINFTWHEKVNNFAITTAKYVFEFNHRREARLSRSKILMASTWQKIRFPIRIMMYPMTCTWNIESMDETSIFNLAKFCDWQLWPRSHASVINKMVLLRCLFRSNAWRKIQIRDGMSLNEIFDHVCRL